MPRGRLPRRHGSGNQPIRRVAVWSAGVLAVLAMALGLFSLEGSSQDRSASDGAPRAPSGQLAIDAGGRAAPSAAPAPGWADAAFFPGSTNTVLLFDTGADGIRAVDLDQRAVLPLTVDGQRSADAHDRLWRADDMVIIAWRRVHALAISTAEARLLGQASFSVPAAEPGHVWLIDDGVGRAGAYRLVSVDGVVQLESPAVGVPHALPRRGVIGGLAMETRDGVAIWDARSREIVVRLGKGQGAVSDARGRTVVWCEDDCARINVTNLDSGHRSFPGRDAHETFAPRSARLSPDGQSLAAIVAGPDAGADGSASVVVVDVSSGRLDSVTPWLRPAPTYLAWSPDGRQLYFSSRSTGAGRTDVGRYVISDGRVELARLPIGGAHSLMPLARDETDALLRRGAGCC